MFKIIAFFIIAILALLYASSDIFLTCAKHSHDFIFSLAWEVLAHKTILAPPSFIEVPVPSQESEWSCICVLGVLILSLPTIFLLTFGTVSTVWYLFVSSFYCIVVYYVFIFFITVCYYIFYIL